MQGKIMKKVSLKINLITGILVVTSQSVFAEKVYESYDTPVSATTDFYYNSKQFAMKSSSVKAENLLAEKCREKGWSSVDRNQISISDVQCDKRNGQYKCKVLLRGFCYGYR